MPQPPIKTQPPNRRLGNREDNRYGTVPYIRFGVCEQIEPPKDAANGPDSARMRPDLAPPEHNRSGGEDNRSAGSDAHGGGEESDEPEPRRLTRVDSTSSLASDGTVVASIADGDSVLAEPVADSPDLGILTRVAVRNTTPPAAVAASSKPSDKLYDLPTYGNCGFFFCNWGNVRTFGQVTT